MKRRYFMHSLAGLVGFSFVGTSCGDDDDDDTPTPVVNPDKDKDKTGDDQQQGGEQQGGEQQGGEQQQPEAKNHVIVVKATEKKTQPWDNQFWIVSNTPFENGVEFELTMDIKADKETTYTDAEGNEKQGVGTQLHQTPGNYVHWDAAGAVHFTTEWTHFTKKGTFNIPDNLGEWGADAPAELQGTPKICQSFAFNLNEFAEANNYYFDNISLKVGGVEVLTNGKCEKEDFSASFAYKLDAGDIVTGAETEEQEVVVKEEETPAE